MFIGLCVLAIWLTFAQSCMKMRISDNKALQIFEKAGVPLSIQNLQVKNRQLHYVVTGKADLPTIIFIHGSPGSWEAFKDYLMDTALLRKYRMVALDRPGFGYSNFGDALPLAEQSEIISPLFQKINNHKPMFLVGHSLGGPMIVQLAADNPNTFSGLVILAGSIDVAQENPERWRPLLMNNPLKFLVPGAMRPSNEELWYLKKDLIALKPLFEKVTCPVYVLHGNKDPLVPYGNLGFASKAFINASKIDTITLVDANHFIPWTRYETIQKVLLSLDKENK